MPPFEQSHETDKASQGSSSKKPPDTRFLLNRGDKTSQDFSASSSNAEKSKGSSPIYWNPKSFLRLGMHYLKAYGEINGGNTVMPDLSIHTVSALNDHSGSAVSALNDHQGRHTSAISSQIQWNGANPTPVEWNGANPTSDAALRPTSELNPTLRHLLDTVGIGDLPKPSTSSLDEHSHQEKMPSGHHKRDVARSSSDELGHPEEASANTTDAKSSNQESGKTRKRDLPPAELCQQALNDQPLVEQVLNNTDFTEKVFNNTRLMQQVLTNKQFVEAVFGNQTFVDTVLANKDFVNNALDKKDFVNNAINSESWANWSLDLAKRYGTIATLPVGGAILGAAAAVVIGRRIRGSW